MQKIYSLNTKTSLLLLSLIVCGHAATSQRTFRAWLSTCSHLVGPTGNPKTLQHAVDQSRGKNPGAPAFDWDVLIDLGDWTASQAPPEHEEGHALVNCLQQALGEDRGRYFSISGNHDGDQMGWFPGEFAVKYINPLGEDKYVETSGFRRSQRPDHPDFRQLLEYPGTRWDRYLIRTGNVVWIMMADRNEFDYLALSRGDLSGTFQAGRGSAAGMPQGGYPSGSVTLDTFYWWKKVVEDPAFSGDILITAHHNMPAMTTITTDPGEPGDYHGKSGSVGPEGEVGGQLYWVREYDNSGKEVNQYAQTRPFLNYLRDHPGAVAVWIGGHTHVHAPETLVNGRGIHVRKYGVTFVSTGALTDTHAGRLNQMTRMLSFTEGSDVAQLDVYIHKSKDGHDLGWNTPAARAVPLGKKFICPAAVKNGKGPVIARNLPQAPAAPPEPLKPRYHWNLNQDKNYDFNNTKFVVGEDGSPYGVYEGPDKIHYSEDTPSGSGRSLDMTRSKGSVVFKAPYHPEMNWKSLTLSIWVKAIGSGPHEVISSGAGDKPCKFRLRYDESAWQWEVGEGSRTRIARAKVINDEKWHLFTGIVDHRKKRILLYIDGTLAERKKWKGNTLVNPANGQLILGGQLVAGQRGSSFEGLVDDLRIYDVVVEPLPLEQQLTGEKTK